VRQCETVRTLSPSGEQLARRQLGWSSTSSLPHQAVMAGSAWAMRWAIRDRTDGTSWPDMTMAPGSGAAAQGRPDFLDRHRADGSVMGRLCETSSVRPLMASAAISHASRLSVLGHQLAPRFRHRRLAPGRSRDKARAPGGRPSVGAVSWHRNKSGTTPRNGRCHPRCSCKAQSP